MRFITGILAPLVFVSAVGCTSAQLAALAKDEALALSYAQQLEGLLSSGAALGDVQKGSSVLLSADPTSPSLQRIDAAIQSAQTAKDLQNADLAVKGVIVLLQTGQAITQAASGQ